MKAENPKAFEKNPLKLESMPVLYGIFAAILVAGGFAFVSPVGSLVLGVASLTGLWFFTTDLWILSKRVSLALLLLRLMWELTV
jgi:hypothetical protein